MDIENRGLSPFIFCKIDGTFDKSPHGGIEPDYDINTPIVTTSIL